MPPNHIVADLSSFQTSALYTATQQVTNNISEANQHPKKKKTLNFYAKIRANAPFNFKIILLKFI